MNRSQSKIRHIQEANKILEKRLLKEVEDDDTSDITPTQQELSKMKDDSNEDEKHQLGKKLTDLFLANQPPSGLEEWLEKNNYKKLLKRLKRIYKDFQTDGNSVLTSELLTWLGGKYFNDTTLKSNIDRINQEHIKKYEILKQELEARKKTYK